MPIPVVCVGNITLGGSGKTPTVLLILQVLKKLGYEVHVVSRGYKGKIKHTTLVDPNIHSALDAGDEPLLISKTSKVWITKNKRAGILAAYRAGANIVVLDDGFQNPSISKDLSILVIDTDFNFGNGHIFPMGPLRESLKFASKRADFILCLGNTGSRKKFLKNIKVPEDIYLTEGQLTPKNCPPALKNKKLIAFCGIARPEKFFFSLKDLGLMVIEKISFPDHFMYSEKDLRKLLKTARKRNALLVTTEKDLIKIPKEIKKYFHCIPIEVTLKDNSILESALKKLVA